jgi:hypothetical protein
LSLLRAVRLPGGDRVHVEAAQRHVLGFRIDADGDAVAVDAAGRVSAEGGQGRGVDGQRDVERVEADPGVRGVAAVLEQERQAEGRHVARAAIEPEAVSS